MVSKKYKVLRSRVYFGEVIIPEKINSSATSSEVVVYKPIRYSLFELNDSDKANDLLNKVPDYNIAESTPNIDLDELCIAHSVYLGYLLEYLGFNEELDYKDICYIRDLLFNGEFSKNHPEVFGISKGDKTIVSKSAAIIDTYYLRLFDSLERSKFSDVLLGDKYIVDPFKRTMYELKKKLWK